MMTAALLLALPALADAQPRGPMGGGPGQGPGAGVPPWAMFHKMMGKWGGQARKPACVTKVLEMDPEHARVALGLNPQQLNQLKQLKAQHEARMDALRLEKKRVKAALKVEWLADRLDEGKLKALQARMLKAVSDKKQRQFDTSLAIARILTPQQRLKLLVGGLNRK
jgi:Spy/CpxP family protein refolding chaperone